MVLDQRDENGVHNVKSWTFEADPEAGLLDFDELKHLLRGLCHEYNVSRIVVDPAHLFAIMDELMREGLPVEDFPQHASRMIPASMTGRSAPSDQAFGLNALVESPSFGVRFKCRRWNTGSGRARYWLLSMSMVIQLAGLALRQVAGSCGSSFSVAPCQ